MQYKANEWRKLDKRLKDVAERIFPGRVASFGYDDERGYITRIYVGISPPEEHFYLVREDSHSGVPESYLWYLEVPYPLQPRSNESVDEDFWIGRYTVAYPWRLLVEYRYHEMIADIQELEEYYYHKDTKNAATS